MLLTVFPGTVISPAIGPIEAADSMFFVVHVLALVFAAIGPFRLSRAVHLVVLPLALVFPVLAPNINP